MNRFCYNIYKSSIEENLVTAGDKIVVSLSGGIDSMALSCLLLDFQEKINLESHWVHFNHGLRPESEEEEAFIRDFSAAKGVPVTIIQTDQFCGQTGMQNKARSWRYNNLHRVQEELGFNKIATGHHLNDLIETQIWRMIRGGSLFSFNPMLKLNPPFIRPLLHTPKKELEDYLVATGQTWREDASNDRDNYTRNLIRNQLIPIMQICAGGKLEEKLLSLDGDARLLKELFHKAIPPETYEQETLSYSTITGQPPLLAAEMIHRYLLYHGQTEVNRANIELIHKQVLSNLGNWSINLKDGKAVSGRYKTISIKTQS